MSVLIIIPARGGSKGIPNKNLQRLGGYPLIAHSITAAFFTRYATEVIVSTDSYEIAEVAKHYGAKVPFIRPAEFATDTSRDIEFVEHALSELSGDYEYIVILRPTSPIRPHGLVNKGITRLSEVEYADSLRVVTKAPATPFKMWEPRGNRIIPILTDPDIPESYNAPRQALPEIHWQTGHLDVIRRETIEEGSITGDYVLPLHIDRKYCIDIDSPEDLARANETYKTFTAEEIVMPCHPSPLVQPRHTL